MSNIIEIPEFVFTDLIRLSNNDIEYCEVFYNNTICLFIHGDISGKVLYEGKLMTFKELIFKIRNKLNFPSEEHLTIWVYCCYGAFQVPYIDEYNCIQSVYPNYGYLWYKRLHKNEKFLCELSYT